MVKGLLIRQLFMAVDLSLALLVAFVIYMVSAKMLDTSAIAKTPVESAPAATTPLEFRRVAERTTYDAIVNGGLFGAAGSTGKPADAELPANNVVVPTSASLKLYGTAASTPTDPLGTAVIENAAAKTLVKVQTYYLGQAVTDELTLLEVHPRRVILLNKAKNQREELAMADTFMTAQTLPNTGKPGLPAGGAAAMAPAHPVIQRQEVAKVLSTSYQDLASQLNPRFQTDDQGNVLGITSDSMSSIPLLEQAGLRDGDVVESVNGTKIRSEQDLAEIFNKYSNSKTIRLGIVRGGAAQMLTVGLE
ncbi:MAG: PDZ domain-containing protein [Candidatus Hydrogenedentes bacterium]|nr:PDZ domain-containing protein [Candidatus Hydrogenedentota bacterium]